MKDAKTSIAKKMNGSWMRLMLSGFLWLDFFLLLLLGICWLVCRKEAVTLDPSLLKKAFVNGAPLILGFQAVLMTFLWIRGYNRVRQNMRSIDQIADDAARRIRRMEEERYRMVEDAIGRIHPLEPDEKLFTGDSELKGLEDAVNRLLARMQESYRMQARFVSDASHELRTPIAVIQGYANLLDRWGKEDGEVLEEGIQAIKAESETMKRLVEQLLFLAREDNHRQPFHPARLDAAELVRTVYDEFRLIDSEHEWKLEVPDALDVMADEDLLKQALRILTENAVKYTPASGTISLKAGETEDGNVFFAVTDQGIGISREDVGHVFERFYRADPARGRESGGSGLGLSIADRIAKQHGGYLNVLSYEEIGTRMTLIIPSAEDEAEI